jgi:hypothetical protein
MAFEDVLAKVTRSTEGKALLKAAGVEGIPQWTATPDLYNDRERGSVSVKWGKSTTYTLGFRMNVAPMCCGIIEINRPAGSGPPEQWMAMMDLFVMAAREMARPPDVGVYRERWGNVLLGSTSNESCAMWRDYIISRKWLKCGTAVRNPRTSNLVTLWKVVL